MPRRSPICSLSAGIAHKICFVISDQRYVQRDRVGCDQDVFEPASLLFDFPCLNHAVDQEVKMLCCMEQ